MILVFIPTLAFWLLSLGVLGWKISRLIWFRMEHDLVPIINYLTVKSQSYQYIKSQGDPFQIMIESKQVAFE